MIPINLIMRNEFEEIEIAKKLLRRQTEKLFLWKYLRYVLLILIRRDAEFMAKAHDEIGAVGKAAVQTRALHRKPRAEQFFCFGKTLRLNIIRRCRLKMTAEASAKRALGNIKFLTELCDRAGWLGIML